MLPIDSSEWKEQNRQDYLDYLMGTRSPNIDRTKEFLTIHYELEGRERKEYDVYYAKSDNDYIPYIEKSERKADGSVEKRFVQVGRMLNPVEFACFVAERRKANEKLITEKISKQPSNRDSKEQKSDCGNTILTPEERRKKEDISIK